MSVISSVNWLSNMRVDVPDLRSIDSSVIADFTSLVQMFVGNNPYILTGFTIPVAGIGGPATALQMVVDSSVVWLPGDINGALFRVQSGTPNEVLNTANASVIGSFSPGTNYVSIQFTRSADPATNDLVAIWDVDSNVEFTITAPRGLLLDYQIVINNSSFGNNAPVAIVTVSGSNVTSIENAKAGLFRLGTGGASPDINNTYNFTINPENSLIATSSSSPDPFAGGDWQINNFKDWMNAVMSEIKRIKGSAFWYSTGSSVLPDVNLVDLWFDSVGSVMTGSGKFKHSQGTPGMLSWTSNLYLRAIIGPLFFTISPNNVTLSDTQVAYITLVRNQDFQPGNLFTFTNTSATVNAAIAITGIVAGDWIKPVADDVGSWRQVQTVAGSSITLSTPYLGPNASNVKALRSQGVYSNMQVASETSVPVDSSTYWLAKRDDNFAGATVIDTIVNSGATRTTNVATIKTTTPHNYTEGQAVVITVTSDSSFNSQASIQSVPSSTTFTYSNQGPDVPAATAGGGSVGVAARLYLRWFGELEQGEDIDIDDPTSNEILQYIGSPNETASSPDYASYSSGSLPLANYNSINGESLTTRASKVTAMLADNWQDLEIGFDTGNVIWDGANVSISGATLTIPGTTIGAAPVTINNITNVALGDNQCLYVDISRSVGSALTLSAATNLSSMTPQAQRMIIVRRLGSKLHFKERTVLPKLAIYEATYADPISTVLPTGATVMIDGFAGVNGDLVLYTNLVSGNNIVYQLGGVGTSITWTAIDVFSGQSSQTPVNNEFIKIDKGITYADQIGNFDGTRWNFNDIVRHVNSAGDYFDQTAVRTNDLVDNTVNGTVFSVPVTSTDSMIVDYSLHRNTAHETGQIYITHDGVTPSISVHNSFLNVSGVTFSATISLGNFNLLYTTTATGNDATLKYSVKRWTTLPGGPSGIPAYSALTTIPTGYLNVAYTMSDGSDLQVNCSVPYLFGGNTRVDLSFPFGFNVNAGTTGGDVEVIADGLVLPRFLPGVTTDAYYKEITSNTIEFWTNLTSPAISLEFRRKQGTIDTNNTNAVRISAFSEFIVGTFFEILSGKATHSSIQAAINDATPGYKILVLQDTFTENLTINKKVFIEGKGSAAILTGNIEFTSGSAESLVRSLNVNGNIVFDVGSTANTMTDCWQPNGNTITDSGTGNLYTVTGY